jgi:hypothetical protein
MPIARKPRYTNDYGVVRLGVVYNLGEVGAGSGRRYLVSSCGKLFAYRIVYAWVS